MTNSLDQWVQKIQAQHPADIELGLDRVIKVANKLNLIKHNPKQQLVLIGGTNGKGTTASILEALSVNSGKSVFCYSSPHILKFNERIRLNGNCIDDKSLIRSFEIIDKARAEIKLTFFEFTTLAAMQIESEFKVDIAIYEMGLGGRLDAVNILQPNVSMITSIGLDHTDWLGESLQQIAAEKVAIARPGKPLIIADDDIEDYAYEAARKYTDSLFSLGTDFFVTADTNESSVKVEFNDIKITMDLPQSVHPKNFAGACFAASKIGFDLQHQSTQTSLKNALNQLFLPGRFETVGEAPEIILDVSHNQQALENLQPKIKRLKGPIKLVCGMLSDKLNHAVLETLCGYGYDWYLVSLKVPRGAKTRDLKQQLNQEQTQHHDNFKQAMNSALADAKGCGSIVVFGSFHMVEAAKRFFKEN